ncbi:hypothetical protein D9M72_537480 [compost metagenome]
MAHGEFALKRDLANEEKEERFPGSVRTDHKPDARPAFGNALDIADHGLDLTLPTNLHVLQAEAGYDTRPERAKNGVAISGLYSWWFDGHAFVPSKEL